MMKKLLLCSVMSIGLFGCATPKYNYTPEITKISKPPVGIEATALVGDQMLVQGKFIEQDALKISERLKVSFAYTLEPGYFVKTGEDENAQYFAALNNVINGGMISKSALADPYKAVMLDKNKQVCVITVFNAKSCSDPVIPVIEKIGVATANSFQQTLIYSGRVGNKINIGYREFPSSLARPAFNNDVEYDLNESKTIGYKGALLEILEATNQLIKYKVLSNFNTTD